MRKKLERPILAEGETTGHCHELVGDVDVFENNDGSREFILTEPVRLKHQEHNTITIPAGDNISDRVVEYDPIEEQIRKVQD